jgi:hypothetical protein
MMMKIISLFGQLELWAPSSGVETYSHQSRMFLHDHDNKPVWPTWAVGALLRSVRCIHINHVCENGQMEEGKAAACFDRLCTALKDDYSQK